MKPLRPHPTEEADRMGRDAEEWALGVLKRQRDQGVIEAFLIPDYVVIDKDEAYGLEVKCQEAFKAPPFDGHGLPKHQALNYERLRTMTGIRTKLFVLDPSAHIVYYQWIDVLERGPSFDTKGTIKTPRRIYALSSFNARPKSEFM